MEGLGSFAPLLLMFVVIYFFMIAPQMRRAKQEKKFAAELKKGDRVITKSGIHGRIVEVSEKDATCIVETSAGRIRFERSAISMEMSKKLNTSVTKK